MCGIAGIIGQKDLRSRVVAMTESLRHRGPDSRGTWYSEEFGIGLGHRRLSVIDLSETGSQPMTDSTGRVTIVFNGEIYNFEALRDELKCKGVAFKGHSDTEVLLQAYVEWGPDALKSISGMFAIGIVDHERGELILARDRCGQKPLFYMREKGEFAFASEIKSLFAAGFSNRRISIVALHEYLAYGYTMGPETLVEGVMKLLPGEVLYVSLEDQELRKQRFWELPRAVDSRISLEEAELELESLLEDSVRRHLVADVPVGILLSGGVDSSLVTSMAARVSSTQVKTFTAIFPGYSSYDESSFARSVSEFFDTEHFELEIEKSKPDVLLALARQFDEPIADHAIVPAYLLSQSIREHAVVALGGDGGDELFGGYPHLQWIQRQAPFRRYIPGLIRNGVSWTCERCLPVGTTGRNHAIGFRGKDIQGIPYINLYFDAHSRARLLEEPREDATAEKRKEKIAELGATPLDQALISDFTTTLPEGYLAKIDRASMLTSLEVRAPWLDDPIVEFAWKYVPSVYKSTSRERKIIPRRLAQRLLPKSLNVTRKQGLTMPLAPWMRGDWGRFLRDVVLDTSQSLFSNRLARRLFKGQQRGLKNQDRIFALAMIVLWSKEYGLSR